MTMFRFKPLAQFRGDQNGSMTYLALTVLMLILLFSGVSLDTTNARLNRTMLQTAADAAARAAVMELPDQTKAVTTALSLANDNLTGSSVNSAVTSNSIFFGRWDPVAEVFTKTTTNPNAVAIRAQRSTATSNALPTMLLRLAGFNSWNVEAETVAYRADDCTVADVATNGTFSITSNNDMYDSYCIVANEVNLNNNNHFDDGNRILVPAFSNIEFNGGTSMSTVVGRDTDSSSSTLAYSDIFKENTTVPNNFVSDVDTLAANYLDPSYANQPSYINTSASVIEIRAKDVKYTSFIPGRIYDVQCGGSKGTKAQFYHKVVVSQIVMVSDCKIQLGSRAAFDDVVLVSRDTGGKSVYAASNVQLGADDACADGGGVQIFTAGVFS